jgi:hypothetical protein
MAGSADGFAPDRLPHLLPITPKYPPPSITSSLLLFCFCGGRSNQYHTASGRRRLTYFSLKAGWKDRFGTIIVSAVSGI